MCVCARALFLLRAVVASDVELCAFVRTCQICVASCAPPLLSHAVVVPIVYCITILPFQIFFVEGTSSAWITVDIIITSECA
jgi:hypothetical protein